ncbi:MAG: DUF2723 domain-containing protein [Candidatus Hydrogenedentes bacterium]|nr:DUF2723 domain-containing protein [Candidatus Hydrogenedentota bacterium]
MSTQSTETKYLFLYPSSYLDGLAPLAAAAVSFAVYLWTLAPTVTGEDSGELIAAAFTLGIPHPPGYPLWCLLAKAFIQWIPYGDVAWRANLLSAVLASFTIYIVGLIVLHLTRSRLAAFAGPLALAFSLEFWEQSVIAEVYTLNALFVALCVYILLRWSKTLEPRLLYAFALVYGLSLCNHGTMLLLLPVFALYILLLDRNTLHRARQYAVMLGLGLLGLSLYLYLPIRSLADPAMDWGNPESWSGFWDVLFRRQYAHLITGNPRTLGHFFLQTSTFAKLYAWEFTPWVGLLAILGCLRLWRDEKAACLLLLSTFLAVALGAILLPNFNLEHHWVWMNSTYWIPAYLVAAVFIGVTIAAIAQVPTVPKIVAPILAAIIVASPFEAHFRHNDRGASYLARDYAQNLLDTMAPNAIYYGSGDHTVFPLLYLQIVEGKRPDVVVLNKYGYPEPELYAGMPEELRAGMARPPSKADTERIFAWLLDDNGRPAYSTIKRPHGSRRVSTEGLLYRYLASDEEAEEKDFWSDYAWYTLDEEAVRGDWTSALILFEVNFARARMYFEEGEAGQATVSLLKAEGLVRRDKHALNNLGTLAAEYGELEQARDYFTKALEADPAFVRAHLNLSKAYLKLGEPVEALAEAEAVLQGEAENADALALQKKALQGVHALQ